jgi:hypothetical protein
MLLLVLLELRRQLATLVQLLLQFLISQFQKETPELRPLLRLARPI